MQAVLGGLRLSCGIIPTGIELDTKDVTEDEEGQCCMLIIPPGPQVGT